MNLMQGDCLQLVEQIPDRSVDLVLTDPPYNIGVVTNVNGKDVVNAWDKIDNYINWCIEWLTLCSKKLRPNGVLYFWHNDMEQIAELLTEIRKRTPLAFVSFCIWDKGDTYRARSWHQRDPNGRTALRSWFNTCEYCLHFFQRSGGRRQGVGAHGARQSLQQSGLLQTAERVVPARVRTARSG